MAKVSSCLLNLYIWYFISFSGKRDLWIIIITTSVNELPESYHPPSHAAYYFNASSNQLSQPHSHRRRCWTLRSWTARLFGILLTKPNQTTLSVKQSVTPAKPNQTTLSVTQNTVNDKESFTRTPTNNKKIILTPIKSPITQIKRGIKNYIYTKGKSFFNISQMRKRKQQWK